MTTDRSLVIEGAELEGLIECLLQTDVKKDDGAVWVLRGYIKAALERRGIIPEEAMHGK